MKYEIYGYHTGWENIGFHDVICNYMFCPIKCLEQINVSLA